MHDPRPAALVALWEGAVSHLEFEMRMVHLRIEHPAVMNRLREPEKPRSALYLAEPFTPTDLMELIAALHAAGVGRRINGTRANVEQLVELFSWMFNVRINNPIQCRRGVINRKLRLTRFLDLLRNSLIERASDRRRRPSSEGRFWPNPFRYQVADASRSPNASISRPMTVSENLA